MFTTKFSEIEYKRPDMEAARKAFVEFIEAFRAAKSYEEAKALYLEHASAASSLRTMQTIASVRNTCDTGDAFYDAEMTYFHSEMPKFGPLTKQADEVLLNSPFRADFEKEFGSFFIKDMEIAQKLESDAIIGEKVEDAQLGQTYSKVVAQCSVDFDGEKCNFYGLLKHMQSTCRDERRRAFETWAKMYSEVAPQLDGIYDRMIQIRDGMAKKLGFNTYIEYIYLQRGRYDYTMEDIQRFRDLVKKYITPACAELYEIQRKRLGVEKLRYYDEAILFPEGNATPIGTCPELVAKAQKMYREMSAETGEFFDFMVEHEMFNLESRPGKHMGGYCTFLPDFKAPFIFSNFNGTSADVDVLTHEAGHAFACYTASRRQPLMDLVWSTSEINEIHSMTMEHFAYPWMETFFADADKYRYFHLIDCIRVIPYMCCVDEFQHRVFEKPEMTADERYTVWREIEKSYMPWRDYDGNEFLEKGGFWMQKQHIFLYPFYYIDYALAQICAFQYYGHMKKDRSKAWKEYYGLCCQGGSKGYFDLLKAGNLEIPFKEEVIQSVTEDLMNELRAKKY